MIAEIVTEGFGSFGSIADVVLEGYASAASSATPVPLVRVIYRDRLAPTLAYDERATRVRAPRRSVVVPMPY